MDWQFICDTIEQVTNEKGRAKVHPSYRGAVLALVSCGRIRLGKEDPQAIEVLAV
jgi:hypothetical protein